LAAVEQLYERLEPELALHFGVSGRATGFEVETRGRNRCSQSADAAGHLPGGPNLTVAGPEYLSVTFPAAHIVERLRRRGLPAMVSRDAGSYLCNALLYRTLEVARRGPEPPRSGFVHLPSTLVNERNPWRGPLPSCRLAWDDVVAGGLEIIAACLGRPSPPVPPLRRRTGYDLTWAPPAPKAAPG
jgi:pyroglutamyl-peptidase